MKTSVSMRTRRNIVNVFVYIFLAVLAIIWLIPIFWMVLQAFNGEQVTFSANFFPKEYTLEHFKNVFINDSSFMFRTWLLNTIIVATATCAISSLLVLMVSYALSRLRFKLRKTFMRGVLVLGMFPGFMAMTAIYYFIQYFGLTQSLLGLILVYSGGAGMGFYIVKGFFDTIPMAVDEAALVDGATRHQVFFRITLPLSKPIIIYTILMAFLAPWGDFIFVSILLRGAVEKFTVAYGLYSIINDNALRSMPKYFHLFFAGATIVATIIASLFMIMQRYYVEGITGGTVKG